MTFWETYNFQKIRIACFTSAAVEFASLGYPVMDQFAQYFESNDSCNVRGLFKSLSQLYHSQNWHLIKDCLNVSLEAVDHKIVS